MSRLRQATVMAALEILRDPEATASDRAEAEQTLLEPPSSGEWDASRYTAQQLDVLLWLDALGRGDTTSAAPGALVIWALAHVNDMPPEAVASHRADLERLKYLERVLSGQIDEAT